LTIFFLFQQSSRVSVKKGPNGQEYEYEYVYYYYDEDAENDDDNSTTQNNVFNDKVQSDLFMAAQVPLNVSHLEEKEEDDIEKK